MISLPKKLSVLIGIVAFLLPLFCIIGIGIALFINTIFLIKVILTIVLIPLIVWQILSISILFLIMVLDHNGMRLNNNVY